MLRKLFFNLVYYQHPIWDTGISPPELFEFIATHAPGRALELGCGTGTNAITLAKHGWHVTAVDYSARAIQKASRKATESHTDIEFLHQDINKLPPALGKFDLILDIGCFHTQPASKRQAYITKIEQFLADGGTYLLYTFVVHGLEELGPGVTEADLRFIRQHAHVVGRKDSTERDIRPSAWLTIMKGN